MTYANGTKAIQLTDAGTIVLAADIPAFTFDSYGEYIDDKKPKNLKRWFEEL